MITQACINMSFGFNHFTPSSWNSSVLSIFTGLQQLQNKCICKQTTQTTVQEKQKVTGKIQMQIKLTSTLKIKQNFIIENTENSLRLSLTTEYRIDNKC